MASQTGTLKFRQSDGTYTDLYPKTTIAQVDGLKTQLDSINTSLQNKVGYATAYNPEAINVSSVYLNRTSSSTGNFGLLSHNKTSSLINLDVADNKKNNHLSVRFMTQDSPESNQSAFDHAIAIILTVNGVNLGAQFLATRNYVNNKITNAINNSY